VKRIPTDQQFRDECDATPERECIERGVVCDGCPAWERFTDRATLWGVSEDGRTLIPPATMTLDAYLAALPEGHAPPSAVEGNSKLPGNSGADETKPGTGGGTTP
jgi:hypothetical protein